METTPAFDVKNMSEINTGNYENLSATDIEAIKAAAKESAASMLRVDAERDLRKDIAKKIKEEYGIKPGDFNALATRYHRQDIAAQKAKFENQSELYQKVFNEGEDGEGEEDE